MELLDFLPIPTEIGYLSLVLVSFFGSLIPFVPIPSFLLLVTMSVGEQFDIHVLAITAALALTKNSTGYKRLSKNQILSHHIIMNVLFSVETV